MTDASKPALLPVIQADRDEAGDVAHGFSRHILESGMRTGVHDHNPIVQAFARHRLDATERAAKVCDDLAATAATVQAALELHGHEAPLKAAQRETAETPRTAIREDAAQ